MRWCVDHQLPRIFWNNPKLDPLQFSNPKNQKSPIIMSSGCLLLCEIILSIILPPLGVCLRYGCCTVIFRSIWFHFIWLCTPTVVWSRCNRLSFSYLWCWLFLVIFLGLSTPFMLSSASIQIGMLTVTRHLPNKCIWFITCPIYLICFVIVVWFKISTFVCNRSILKLLLSKLLSCMMSYYNYTDVLASECVVWYGYMCFLLLWTTICIFIDKNTTPNLWRLALGCLLGVDM